MARVSIAEWFSSTVSSHLKFRNQGLSPSWLGLFHGGLRGLFTNASFPGGVANGTVRSLLLRVNHVGCLPTDNPVHIGHSSVEMS